MKNLDNINRTKFINDLTTDINFNPESLEFLLTEKESEVYDKLKEQNKEKDIVNLIINSFQFRRITKKYNLRQMLENKSLAELESHYSLSIKIDYYLLEDYNKYKLNVSFNINKLYDDYSLMLESKEKIILRLEDKHGDGIYSKLGYILESKCPNRNPDPFEDENINKIFYKKSDIKYRRKWYFGFQNHNQIKNWLFEKNDLEQLKKKDFLITEYKVSENFVVESDTQLIFLKEKATKIKSYTIDEYIKNKDKKIRLKSGKISR